MEDRKQLPPRTSCRVKRQENRIRKMVSVTLSPDVIELMAAYVEDHPDQSKSGLVESALIEYCQDYITGALEQSQLEETLS